MVTDKSSKDFNKGIVVIRHRGQQNKAQLPNGKWVERQEKLWYDDWAGFIPCASYEEHFVYLSPFIGSGFMCTCGSPAVIVGLSGYVLDASPQGKMLVCLHHASSGLHATGGSRWV